jgi:tight adherence protein C
MMLHFILIVGLFFLAIGVTLLLRGVMTPAGPSTETIEQIGHYGFGGTLPETGEKSEFDLRGRLDDVTGRLGRWLGNRFSRLKGRDYRTRLIAAGMYQTTPERLLGIQFLAAVGGLFLWFLLGISSGMAGWLVFLGTIAVVVLGWKLPTMIVDSRGRKRRDLVERTLPDLIDLLVVTLEAGLSFPQSLRLAAQKIKEPLSSEVRLTLQEQNMGLTLVEALENFLGRVNTPGVRMFARSIAQGETMGVSTGHIMRNLALEMRKRQRAYAEERAQKAPIKILFPILFLIMPSLFIVILLPVFIRIADAI